MGCSELIGHAAPIPNNLRSDRSYKIRSGSWILFVHIQNMSRYLLQTGLLASRVAASLYGESNLNHTCVVAAPPLLSCSPPILADNASEALDTCCVETYGGLWEGRVKGSPC